MKPEFGTGALKITPGHDPNDFEIGRRHGLEEINVIGEDGRMTEAAGERFAGPRASTRRARPWSRRSSEEGLISQQRAVHARRCRFSHRSGERIEPLISLQWFCDMDELAEPAIEAVRRRQASASIPSAAGRVYLDWLENIRPWCISRQLWWGHRLPVWYCDACDETFVARRSRPSAAAPATASCDATRTCSTPGSPPRCGRSRRSAGRQTRRSCARSTRPTCWSRRATSSSSGSRGW